MDNGCRRKESIQCISKLIELEKDFIDSCDVQPLLWLRLLDDIFMIWDDNEENLLRFLDKLNNFHETIKFTYNYSKTNAVFLAVKLEKSDDMH